MKDHIIFGEEWKKEMMKFKKEELVEALRKAYLKNLIKK